MLQYALLRATNDGPTLDDQLGILQLPLKSFVGGLSLLRCHNQGCSGAIMRRIAVPANIFEPERRSGKYCLSQAER